MGARNRRAKRGILVLGIAIIAAILGGLVVGCSLFYEEYNPDSRIPVDFIPSGNRIVFGTSTGDTTENRITIDTSTETVNVYARNDTNNAGKIAGSEDGITFFFTEVAADRNFQLSANITVISFGGIGTEGETTSNGQEGFGLMVRDYVPQYPGATMDEFLTSAEYSAGSTGGSSNMVMVGGIKRGVRAAVRMGVTGSEEVVTNPLLIPDASKSTIEWWPKELPDYSPYPTLEERPDFPLIGGVYQFTLVKNNNGFVATIVPPPEKGAPQEYFIPEPDILTEIRADVYYVGLFAARAAEISVSDISYFESNQADDAPREEQPPEILTPEFEILSPSTNSDDSYKLYARANVRGYVSVRQNGVLVPGAEYVEGEWLTEPTSSAVEPFSFFDIPVYPLQAGENTFRVMFHPADGQDITDNNPISKTFFVERRSYFDAATPIYAGPDGRAANQGTYASPLDIQTAIDFVLPGQTIIMKNGVYQVLSFRIPRYNSGRFGSPKRIEAEDRDQVFVDFNRNIYATGAVLGGSYWEIDGIHIRNTADKVKGLQVMGSNNLIEWVKTYSNGDTGFQISGRSTEPKSFWPRNNTVRYCESYNNMDAAQTDADGFAAKLTVGEGNRFEWCLSHNNGDDGWDLFTKKETGEIWPVVIENSISYQNGLMLDGTETRAGRNGFKLGGEGLSVEHEITNCLAFQNGAHGFTSNSNPAIHLEFVTSFDNGGSFNAKLGADARNFNIYDGTGAYDGLDATIEGLLSFYSLAERTYDDGTDRREDKLQQTAPVEGYVWRDDDFGSLDRGDGSKDYNGTTLTVEAHVISSAIPLWDASYLTPVTSGPGFVKRNPDGTFDIGDFMKLNFAPTFPAGCNL
jgi:pectate disaccharide-lyase